MDYGKKTEKQLSSPESMEACACPIILAANNIIM